MPYISFEDSCTRLIGNIRQLGYTLENDYITPDVQPNDVPDPWIASTRLYGLMLGVFGPQTCEWLHRLKSEEYQPDWYAVTVNPDTSPLEQDDWIIVAQSKMHALASVLQGLQLASANVTNTQVCENGDIIFHGDRGVLAVISSIQFNHVPDSGIKRVRKAIKGLRVWDQDEVYCKALQGVDGLHVKNAFLYHPDRSRKASDGNASLLPVWKKNHQLIDESANNLVSNFRRALPLFVKESVPQSVAQELIADFCGFPSFNHFKALEKKRSKIIQDPYILVVEDVENPAYEVLGYYRGISSAIYAFGQQLKKEQRRTYHFSPGMFFKLSNYTRLPRAQYQKSGRCYKERFGLSLKILPSVSFDEEYLYVAAALLDSADLDADIKEYLVIDPSIEIEERVVRLNRRYGAMADNHVFANGWVYWTGKRDGHAFFKAENIAEFGKRVLQPCISSLEKAAIVRSGDSFWLATDWDKKPVHPLPELDNDLAERVETQLLRRENWRQETRLKHSE